MRIRGVKEGNKISCRRRMKGKAGEIVRRKKQEIKG
jgi:hypothetical protein